MSETSNYMPTPGKKRQEFSTVALLKNKSLPQKKKL
jgi:hypothetical protein